jgi:hypothetical protein
MIRIVHNAAMTFLVASGGFIVASFAAHHTASFKPWADALVITGLGNFVLAIALYALLALALVGRGIVGLIASRRRAQP